MRNKDSNLDPLTREPGSHPVGTAAGSAAGAAAVAVIGAPFGPIGVLVGGAIGAVAGARVGHLFGEALDPTEESEFWRDTWRSRPYVMNDSSWSDYEPAYRYGWESRDRLGARAWDDRTEKELREQWEQQRGSFGLDWERSRDAVRDAWERSDRTFRTYASTDSYWRARARSSSYYDATLEFDRDYRPAYRFGAYSRAKQLDREWDTSVERELQLQWDRFKAKSRLGWEKAKPAVRDGWNGFGRTSERTAS